MITYWLPLIVLRVSGNAWVNPLRGSVGQVLGRTHFSDTVLHIVCGHMNRMVIVCWQVVRDVVLRAAGVERGLGLLTCRTSISTLGRISGSTLCVLWMQTHLRHSAHDVGP